MPRPRILVVDDEPGMLRTIERVLSEQYEVRTARLPSQGLAAATQTSFDLAILDVRMPEVDGFTLMARLGDMQPDLDVILMTGSTDERDARLVRAIREKAFFFLTKPFDREVLLTLVQRCLDARRLNIEKPGACRAPRARTADGAGVSAESAARPLRRARWIRDLVPLRTVRRALRRLLRLRPSRRCPRRDPHRRRVRPRRAGRDGDGDGQLAELAGRLAGLAPPGDSSGASPLAVVREEVARFAEGRPLVDDLTVMLIRRL